MDHLDPNVSLFAVASREFDNSAHKLRVKDVARGFIRERVATKAAPFAALARLRAKMRHHKNTLAAASVYAIEFKRIQRFKDFTIPGPRDARVRDCKDADGDPKLQVFKDLKLRNTELFRNESQQRVPFYPFRFYALGYTL